MSRPLRLVFDTNVYIAAIISPEGYAARYVAEAGIGSRYKLYISHEILAEIRGKIAIKTPNNIVHANNLISYVESVAHAVAPLTKIFILDDEPDNRILECAVAAKADLIVSFDKDLLRLKEYEGSAIIHPSKLQDYFPK